MFGWPGPVTSADFGSAAILTFFSVIVPNSMAKFRRISALFSVSFGSTAFHLWGVGLCCFRRQTRTVHKRTNMNTDAQTAYQIRLHASIKNTRGAHPLSALWAQLWTNHASPSTKIILFTNRVLFKAANIHIAEHGLVGVVRWLSWWRFRRCTVWCKGYTLLPYNEAMGGPIAQ